MAEALVDSSFLYALYNQDDRAHLRVSQVIERSSLTAIVPEVILPEVVFLLRRDGGIPAVAAFLESFRTAGMRFEHLTLDDLARAREIMLTYRDAHLDFVDCAIMTLSERLNITRVFTLDRRDFALVRPTHCEFFELLP